MRPVERGIEAERPQHLVAGVHGSEKQATAASHGEEQAEQSESWRCMAPRSLHELEHREGHCAEGRAGAQHRAHVHVGRVPAAHVRIQPRQHPPRRQRRRHRAEGRHRRLLQALHRARPRERHALLAQASASAQR